MPPKPILPNGSAWVGGATEVLQFEQHRKHALELAIEMNLIASKTFEPVRVDRFTKRLCSDQRPVFEFSPTLLIPRQDLGFQEPPEASGIGGIGYLVLLVVV